MNSVMQNVRTEDKAMARQLILDFARRFDPSWLMAILMGVVYASLRMDTDAPILTWALNRIRDGVGLNISPALITESLIVFAVAIATFRPPPRWTFVLSLPLAVYIAFAAWYGYGAHQLPLPVVSLLAFAYGAHFWIHMQASAILVALRRIAELEARLKASEPGGVDVPPIGE